jgi:hypothetical protein
LDIAHNIAGQFLSGHEAIGMFDLRKSASEFFENGGRHQLASGAIAPSLNAPAQRWPKSAYPTNRIFFLISHPAATSSRDRTSPRTVKSIPVQPTIIAVCDTLKSTHAPHISSISIFLLQAIFRHAKAAKIIPRKRM